MILIQEMKELEGKEKKKKKRNKGEDSNSDEDTEKSTVVEKFKKKVKHK